MPNKKVRLGGLYLDQELLQRLEEVRRCRPYPKPTINQLIVELVRRGLTRKEKLK